LSDHVRTEVVDRILEIELRRHDKRNAITTDMYLQMAQALERAQGDPGVRAVCISGGPFFTAGNDLSDFLAAPPADESAPVFRFLTVISTLDKPIVAAVAGQATGIGTTMLLHCDVVVAAPDARFHTPFADLGLVPEAGSSLLLPLAIGRAHAVRMLMLGEALGAEEALRFGLVTAIVASEELLGKAREYAARLAAKAPAALAATKRLIRSGIGRTVRDQMAVEVEVFRERVVSAEAREAFTAFLQKRAPRFEDAATP